jgi:hypothetical protein
VAAGEGEVDAGDAVVDQTDHPRPAVVDVRGVEHTVLANARHVEPASTAAAVRPRLEDEDAGPRRQARRLAP